MKAVERVNNVEIVAFQEVDHIIALQVLSEEVDVFHFWHNDERMHHYQRGRTSITGLMVELRKIIETERLVVKWSPWRSQVRAEFSYGARRTG